MPLARSLALVGCLSALGFAGCYRPPEKVGDKSGSGGTHASGTATKSGPLPQIVVTGTDIPDDRNSKTLQMVTVEQIREQSRRDAESHAAAAAAASRKTDSATKPTASASATAQGTATPSGTASVAAAPSATVAGPKPSASFDPYLPPAIRRENPIASAEVRPDRNPPRQVKPGVPPPRTRVLAAPTTSGGTLGITFDSLMFDMKATDVFSPTMLNDSVRALLDKKVKIRGYIHPASAMVEKGLTQFVLVRDDQGCCFGPGALLYDNIVVKMLPGKSTKYSVRPIAVEGVLTYKESMTLGNQPTSIFQIDADAAE